MNRSITGAWSQSPNPHARRAVTKVSLNSPLPPPGSAAAAAIKRAEEEAAAALDGTTSSDNAVASTSRIPLDAIAAGTAEGADSSVTTPIQGLSAPGSPGSQPLARSSSVVPEDDENPASSSTATKRKIRTSSSALQSSSNSSTKRPRKPPMDAAAIAAKYAPPETRLEDFGGIGATIEKVQEIIQLPLTHPEIYTQLGIRPPRGVLLHGPPGCGKTMLAGAIAGHLGVPFLSVSAPSIVSGTSGESEATLRQTFEEAVRIAPSILFIDEIDAITPKRETAGREMERRIVAQLLTCLDDLGSAAENSKSVMVIGATNRPDALDPALRRAGRFDHEISLGVPDEAAREQILRVLAHKMKLSGDFDFHALARSTPGYVGADLTALTSAAGVLAVKRIFADLGENAAPKPIQAADVEMEVSSDAEPYVDGVIDGEAPGLPVEVQAPTMVSISNSLSSIAKFLLAFPRELSSDQLESLSITNADFLAALPTIQPSSKREGFATVPDVTWADVGALHDTREELSMAIVEPVRNPELFKMLGVQASSGVLLWGPPGCGKTLLAKAVANESRANFISVKGPELLNKYVGESERSVRQVFSRARTSAPCVIFFDELDALVPRRDDTLSEASSRVVNTLLTELDGLESRGQVYVIAATNRPDMIDPAMCRPGRLDKLLYVDLPSQSERLEILRTITKDKPLSEGLVDLQAIAAQPKMEGFSGADLANLVREAAFCALKHYRRQVDVQIAQAKPVILHEHFVEALQRVSPSVTPAQRLKYQALRSRLSGDLMAMPASADSGTGAGANGEGVGSSRRQHGGGRGGRGSRNAGGANGAADEHGAGLAV